SFAQQRLWVVDRLEPGSAAYNMPFALRLRGALDAAALRAGLDALVRRHETLRTTFAERDGAPVQVIHPATPVPLPVVDLRALPDVEREAAAGRLAAEESLRPFDLARGPLLRSTLLRLAADDHVLCFTLHHVVSDGWSMGVLVRELSALYDACSRGEPTPLAELAVQYADYAVWQRAWLSGEVLERQLGYWREKLGGAPPLLEIPTDRPRPAALGQRGASRSLRIDPPVASGLRALGHREGATPFMILLAGFAALLGRYSGQADVVVGTPIANRTRRETEGLIGFFLNTLALRTDLSGDPTFRELLGRVRETTLGAYAHQDLPFERVLEELQPVRSLSYSPVFQVMLNLQNFTEESPADLGGARMEPFGETASLAKYDLTLYAHESDGGIRLNLVYNADLFEDARMAELLGHLRVLLGAVVSDPGLRISAVPLLTAQERRERSGRARGVTTDRPFAEFARGEMEQTIPARFEARARLHPERLAVRTRTTRLTYAELDRAAEGVARAILRARPAGPERVALLFEHDAAMIVGILGVLKAGKTYVPLDPLYPRERSAYVLEDSGAAALVTNRANLERARDLAGGGIPLVEVGAADVEEEGDGAAPRLAVSPDEPAYILYTSGSTGQPKGVVQTHRNVLHFIRVYTNNLRIGPDDRLTLFSSYTFDAAVMATYGALLNGAALFPFDWREEAAAGVAEWMRREGITLYHSTPTVFRHLVGDLAAEERFPDVRLVVLGGEETQRRDVEAFRAHFAPGAVLVNGLGPTESTVTLQNFIGHDTPIPRNSVPVGLPVDDTEVVLQGALGEQVAVYGVGEILIRSPHVAPGYWRKPEQTARAFADEPESGVRSYRTGDLGRRLPDGTLEFMGRSDFQVKVRGFRVEPGEVEAALRGHPAVREAVVTAHEGGSGERWLAGYVVAAEGAAAPAAEELRGWLRGRLPEYMVPPVFVAVEALPLTPSGKVDRLALPAPERAESAAAVAPRTPTEEVLAGIWAEVLGVDGIGAGDDFFALGGHSLLATRVMARVREAFGVEVPLRSLFELPTVGALAERIEALRSAGAAVAPPIRRVSREAPRALPLSFAQQRLWVVDRLEPNSPAYNLPYALRLRGELDTAALRASLDGLVRRHETLRTTFADHDGSPVQVVHPPAPVELAELDLRDRGEAEREAEARRLAAAEALLPFDLARGPLLRCTLLRLADRDHVLCFTLHHIVSDGWSRDVLVREVSVLYAAAVRGVAPRLPELAVQYADYAVWQREWLRGETLEEQIGYWRERLAGIPPLLEIPVDRPRAPGQSPRAAGHAFRLPSGTAAGLRELSRREGTTLFMTLLAAWQALLSRYSGQEEVVVGSPIAGRTRREVEGLIGFFVNMLPLRGDLAGAPTWRELLGRVRGEALGAYEHQDLPFDRLVEELSVERSLTHSPVFQATFALNRPGGGDERLLLDVLAMEPFGGGDGAARFDLDLVFTDAGDALSGGVVYRAALFEPGTIARMAGHLETLLEALAADPRQRAMEVPLLRGAERVQVLDAWNATGPACGAGEYVHDWITRQALGSPDAEAVRLGERVLSYGELERGSGRLARHLRGLGVGPETRVGLCLERSPEMVAGVLGVLRAGGAYVPLDPSYPPERLAFMVEDAAPSVLLTRDGLLERLPSFGGAVVLTSGATEYEVRSAPRTAASGDATLPQPLSPDNLAYVLYTSGSTGRPKGVEVVHRGLSNYLAWAAGAYAGQGHGAPVHSSLSFDLTITSLLVPLLRGERVVLTDEAEGVEGLARALREEPGFTLVKLTPAHLGLLAEQLTEAEAAVAARTLVVGGESLPGELARYWMRVAPETALVNEYGPTETVVGCSVFRVRDEGGPAGGVPIGGPIAGTRAYVLGPGMQPVPVGLPGELYVGGAGVARGYRGRADLTAERFVPDAFGREAGARLYRTGDRARRRADGELEYLGRVDTQVKLRGFRIEPGEVEAVLLEHEGVREAVVAVRDDAPGQARLVAYVVPREGEAVTAAGLRERLGTRLPEYMVPSAFVLLETMPLNANGKVDRRALPEPGQGPGVEYVAPRTAAEEVLAGIWAEVLKTERVGAAENFFALGGHSLLATQVVSRARQAFGVEVPLRELFEAPTVAGLAARVEALRSSGASPAPPIGRVRREGPLPPSFAQQRLWVVDRLEPGSPAYNLPYALRLRGVLDPRVLRAGLDALVRRHETLRTTLAERDGAPSQVVHPPARVPLPVLDLGLLPGGAREREAERLAGVEALRPFDLARGPLLRCTLLRLADDDHVLSLTLHHVVSDGWSVQVLVRDVSALYAALSRGEPSPLAELPVQYADYATWQREWLSGPVLEEQIGWWKERLAGAPPLLEIPTDAPRALARSPRVQRHAFVLPPGLLRGLRELSRREGATLFMTLLAGWQALLGRYAGQEDVVVGSPIAGRNRRETEELIGMFVNMLALRGDLSGDPTWRELLGRVRRETLGAYDHQELPFERLVEELGVERSLAHAPVFQVAFALNRAGGQDERLELGELVLEPFGSGEGAAKFDLFLTLAGEEESPGGVLAYRAGLFRAETVERMAGHLEALLEAMVADPGRRLSTLSLLRGAERTQVLEAWNDTAAALPRACVHELFAEQASRTPGAPAVLSGGGVLGYAELEHRANRLAHLLVSRGVGPETRVGMCMERGADAVVALLGILKAGGAYVPLDPTHPAERLREVLADAGVSVVLTQAAAGAQLPAEVEPLWLDDAATADALAALPETAPAVASHPGQMAYVIYTSGSTGRPKGVAVSHASVVRLVRNTNYVPFGPEERIAHVSNLAFDAAVFEIWGALLNGGSLAVVEREVLLAPAQFARALREGAVTAMFLTGAVFNRVAHEAPDAFRGCRHVLVGGEAVDAQSARRVLEAGGPARLLNGYGPTETTTFAAWHEIRGVEPHAQTVPIGRALANTTLYVVDGGGEPQPVGVPGELWVGGAGVARGYLGWPEATAERFVPDAFGGDGARLYRTGDRVRWNAGGELEYLGRLDAQVKIRGFRIEPGEVEAALLALAGVREAAVVVREDLPGQKRLVGYVVPQPGAELSASELRARLSSRLPAYLVPGAYVTLESMPLTPNGKVDRRALPAPEPGAGAEHAAPRTAAEEVLAGIWAEVLGLSPERVGVEASFFELGGHSLLATQVVSRARQAFGVEVPLRALFEAQTVAALAGRIEALRHSAAAIAPPITRVPRGEPLPLSFAQQRLRVVDRLDPGSAAYNVPSSLRLRGRLELAALRRSVDALVARHEALRTTFAERDGAPVQVVHPPARVPLPVVDLRALPAGERAGRARRLAGEEALRPFDLARGPLLRVTLLRLDEEDQVLCFTMHHVICDGWSMDVLVREVSALYAAAARGEEPDLPPLPVQYADYAVWQQDWLRGEVLEAQLGYWKERLAGAPPLLEIPTDRPRAAGHSPRAGSHRITLPDETARLLRELSRRERATLFMTVLTAWQALLSRYAGQDDVVVGAPVAGRTRRETEGLIGFFVNMLALRADLARDPTWAELMGRVREAALGAYDHQELPFERLVDELTVDRSLAHTPLVQVIFNLERSSARGPLTLGALAVERFATGEGIARFDLNLAMTEQEGRLGGVLHYREALFEADTVARMAGHLEVLLESMAADPQQRLSELSLLRGAERVRVLETWNATGDAGSPGRCLHELFAEQAVRTPGAAALGHEGGTLTYAQLDRAANRLAHHLRRRGVGPEARVAVLLDPSPRLVVALLGILKAGGAYIPLDPSTPPHRLALVLADAGVSLLVHDEGSRAARPASGAGQVCLDADAAQIESERDDEPATGVRAENAAYLIYTSGSTGRPKGVLVEHRQLSSYVHAVAGRLELRAGMRHLLASSVAADLGNTVLYPALCTGGALHVVPREVATSGERFAEYVERQEIDVLKIVPSHLAALLAAGGARVLPRRLLVLGGEASPRAWVDELRARAPGLVVVNHYGPTETTVGVLTHQVADPPAATDRIPLGRPLANTRSYVLDASGQPVPPGVAGELYVGGAQVARGYAGGAEQTAERFVPDGFGAEPGGRLYRTGDRVRWLPAGELEFLGRVDEQVKLRGFRVEPGEVVAALVGHDAVREAVVVPREDAAGQALLVAYVVMAEGAKIGGAGLREHLGTHLPEYMVPSAFVMLERLPLNANGKVDRRALPAPGQEDESGHVAPRTATEEVLGGIWAEVLKVEQVGVEESFFEMGGHSLLAMLMVSRTRKAFGVEVPLRVLFKTPTIAALARHIETLRRAGAGAAPPMERVTRDGPLPLSFAQQRLWLVDQLEPGSPAYNMPYALRLRGELDTAALRASLDELVGRHETLRTTFSAGGGEPAQVVHPPTAVAMPVVDLRGVPDAEREAGRLAGEEAMRPFDLGQGPLLRSMLLRLADGDHVLCFTLHHIVSDGWSMQVLVREVSALYAASVRGEAPRLPALEIQYADFAVWQRDWLRGAVLEEQIGYWRERLAGAPPLLEIPTSRPRAAGQSVRAGSHRFALSAEVTRRLREISRHEGATLFMTLLAGWQALLARYAGQDDVVVGSPIAGRNQRETEELIGFFVNMLALRTDLSGDPTWVELLGRVRESALGAYDHQELPFERLVEELSVERSLTHAPVFQAIFTLNRSGRHVDRLELGELSVEPVGGGERAAKFDLDLAFVDGGGALNGVVVYRAALFEAETIARMAGHLEVVLEAMAASPKGRLSAVSLLREGERAQLLAASHPDALGLPPACVHELFAARAARAPGAPALAFGDETLTYAELERRSNRLARHLRTRGVGPEVRVGLCLERGVEMVVGVLGILKAGGAYVPLDPAYPAERLAYTLGDSGASLLLTQGRLLEALPAFAGEVVRLDA
ncbi:MAG: non-ribosomal peptide synthase/polyketide synthase, partial [Longimicrobiaceae bacterium]